MKVMQIAPKLFHGDLDGDVAAQFAAADRIAWDIETSGLNPHEDRIGTIQLHADEIGSVVVQVSETAPRRACALLADERIGKVFHHAMFDLRFMVAHWGVTPRNVLCTKVASKLLTPKSDTPHSLQSLLARYLNVTISKDQRTTDWLALQLTPAQVAYACSDVEYLLPLLDRLVTDLQRADRYAIYRACLEFLPTRVQLDLGDWSDVFAY